MFQHTAARRRLGPPNQTCHLPIGFNTQPPEGGWFRPTGRTGQSACFNTQPPEGGWYDVPISCAVCSCFNTQPPEGGWWLDNVFYVSGFEFQHTAARRRLAPPIRPTNPCARVSTHSRPKAAGSSHT